MDYKVHKIRYYNPKPQPIHCVSYNKVTKNLAVARGDASIEIWDLNYAPYLTKFICGVENGSIEALGWVQERLLSTGLGGSLVEWDLDKLCPKDTVILTGYAAWCLDVNSANTLVAIGTEQGYLNLYSVEYDGIVYKKLFDKQEGRIMCCKFDSTGNTLVTGSVNTIRVWNVATGHAVTRISVRRRGIDTIVWCVAMLSDNVIVSGDSHGRLTFWDSTVGEQIESYSSHRADILSIAVSEDEKSLYCSGVDPIITNYVKIDKSSGKNSCNQWVKSMHRQIHEHDVRCLVMHGDKLISVGADGYLTMSSFLPKMVMRIPPMLPAPRSSVCSSKSLVLLRYSNHLEVWKLGSYVSNKQGDAVLSNVNVKQNNNTRDKNQLEQDTTIAFINTAERNKSRQEKSLKLSEGPLKLVSVHAKGKKQIRCCELSPSGEFIVYATDIQIRMLKLETDRDQNNTSLSKVLLNGASASCDRLCFSGNSRGLAVHYNGSIQVLQVDPEAGATVVQTIPTYKHLKTATLLHLLISKETASGVTYLVAADTAGAISIWARKEKKFDHFAALPRYHCIPSAITVDDKRDILVVVYVDQKIIEYELSTKKIRDIPNLPVDWLNHKSAAMSVTVHPKRDALVVQDNTALWVLESKPKADEEKEPEVKKKKQKNNTDISLRCLAIKYLAGFHWLSDGEAVAIEILPENILSQLPPILATKRHNFTN